MLKTNSEKAIIISIPKAGTYLFSEVLKNLGYNQTFMHLNLNHYEQYDPQNLDLGRAKPSNYRISLPLNKTLEKIEGNQFAVSHLPYSEEILNLLNGFKIIFLKRNLKNSFISRMNFLAETLRNKERNKYWLEEKDDKKRFVKFLKSFGEEEKEKYLAVARWNDLIDKKTDKIIGLNFENLVSKDEKVQINCIRQIAEFLNKEKDIDYKKVIENSLGAKTLTKSSSGRPKIEKVWSVEAEEWFLKNNLIELNKQLGYSD